MGRKLTVALAIVTLLPPPGARAQNSISVAEAPGRASYGGAVEAGRTFLGALMREADLTGLQVAVARDGRVVWSEGFGYADLEQRTPVTTRTKFRIGSLGKPLTAAAAMKLHQVGHLDLDAPVRRYVPSFPEKGHPLTSRQLLGHLGGIRHSHEAEDQLRYRRYGDVLDALELFAGDSLLHRPGTAYEYSSYGYTLLSAVIQEVSGQRFLAHMRDAVFRPLEMDHTVADHPDSLVAHRAEFYRESDEDGRLLNAPFTDNSYKWAAGGYLSTAEDLVRFGSGLLMGKLIRPSSVDTLFTSMTTAAGDTTGYGMGWRPRRDWEGRKVVRHGGSTVGGRAFLMLWPGQGLAVAILVNASLAPVFHEEAQTLAHFFLDHAAGPDRFGSEGKDLSGSYRFMARRGDEEVTGLLRLTGSRLHPGWMEWEGGAAPVPLLLVDRHDGETRIVGTGVHGALNLWACFEEGGFRGRWNWLGRTSDIRGRSDDGGWGTTSSDDADRLGRRREPEGRSWGMRPSSAKPKAPFVPLGEKPTVRMPVLADMRLPAARGSDVLTVCR